MWQRRDVVMGGNLSTEFKLPKAGAKGGKSDTLCSMNANLNNKGNGQVCGRGRALAYGASPGSGTGGSSAPEHCGWIVPASLLLCFCMPSSSILPTGLTALPGLNPPKP